jgi:hypothetical protein
MTTSAARSHRFRSFLGSSGPGRRALFIAGALAASALLACAAASDDDADGPPDFSGSVPGGSGAPGTTGGLSNTPSNPAGMNNPGSNSPGGTNNPGSNPGSTDGQTGVSGPVVGAGGAGSGTGNGGAGNVGAAGSVNAGGSAQVDPNAGAAGSSMNAGGAAPVAGAGGGPAEPPPPVGSDIDCPAGASFCSGFESGVMPNGTMPHAVGPGSAGAFLFETNGAFAGTSLVVPATGSGGFFYRALAVPIPGQNFWVRLYMNLSTPLGDNSHDSVFGGSSGAITADVNNEALVELSEQFNEILLNTDDALFNPAANNTLPANQWLCMEAHYDGGSGDVQIFADGQELINAPAYRAITYQSFRIGYMRYNDDRTVRFDDVIVAPARIGCD